MPKPPPRGPDLLLKISAKNDNKGWHRIGAAWLNDSGAISVVLDPCVTLSWRDNEDHTIILSPVEREK